MSDLNIFPQEHAITKNNRNKLLGNKSFAVWFTGLSGSGKSTLANYLEQRLFDRGILTYTLDGDNIRAGLNKDLGFDIQDRKENIRRIGEVTKLMVDSGIVVLTAFISPLRNDREAVRKLLRDGDFLEIYVRCPINICQKRDVKGLYSRVKKGDIKNFTGIDSQYEEPLNPELIVDTDKESIEECVKKIYNFVNLKL